MRQAFRKRGHQVANIISPLFVSAPGYQLFHPHAMLSFAFFRTSSAIKCNRYSPLGNLTCKIYEYLAHDNTYKIARAPSENSDHPEHPPSQIKVFVVHKIFTSPKLRIEYLARIGLVSRVIRVFDRPPDTSV